MGMAKLRLGKRKTKEAYLWLSDLSRKYVARFHHSIIPSHSPNPL
jgi:hypothetical protein